MTRQALVLPPSSWENQCGWLRSMFRLGNGGRSRRGRWRSCCTAKPTQEPIKDPLFLINPEIVWRSEGRNVYEEGCLSIPEYYAEVERPESCRVQFLDRDGKEQQLEADGILSTCIQHEVDHLDGVLFIDHISKLKRDMVIRKFTKAAKQSGRTFIG